MGEGEFSTADHLMALKEESHDGKIRDDANNDKLKIIVYDLEAPDRRLILRAKKKVPG